MRVLVLGVTGMLGSVAFRLLEAEPEHSVFGTTRSAGALRLFPEELRSRIFTGIDAENFGSIVSVLERVRPDVVINCIGVVKQLTSADDPLIALPINSLLPHKLARLCHLAGARLIHFSTDCVFSGRKGNYSESDFADAGDLYGRSKLLGEPDDEHTLTIRTSIIGRELTTQNGLVEWFLHAGRDVAGYTKVIFTGLTTDELTRVVAQHVLPRSDIRGVYHVGSEPICKYDLLQLINSRYGLDKRIEPDGNIAIDRSLDSNRFRTATGYCPPAWPDMIAKMHALDAKDTGVPLHVQ